jgi:transcriptional regulator with XRE-family HTH domain
MGLNRVNEIVTANIKRLMEKTPNLDNQSKLARKSGVAQATIGRILRKEVSANIDTLDLLAQAFGVAAYCLLSSPEEIERISSSLPTNSKEFLDQYGEGILNLPEMEQIKLSGKIEMLVDQYRILEDEKERKSKSV